MRAKEATLNTHICALNGTIGIRNKSAKTRVSVRFTSEMDGETISLADDTRGVMLAVSYEQVERLIREARKERPSHAPLW